MRRVSLLVCSLACLSSSAFAARPVVAVVDSGIAATAELRPHLIGEIDAASRTARPALRPRHAHGTMVATVLSRAAEGQVDILSVRVDGPGECAAGQNPPCQRDPEVIAWAIYSAVAYGADVINLSVALSDAPAIRRAVAFAAWHGAAVVMASGNDARPTPGNLSHARAGYPNTVLVGALDQAGARWWKSNAPTDGPVSGYSFVWRLGVDVPTVLPDGQPTTANGTSLAAPVEAAYRARLRAAATASLVHARPGAARRRPVMLAGAMYPNARSRACLPRRNGRVSPHCLGSVLIA